MRIRYDAESNAAYIRLSEEPVVESEEVSPGIVFDFDASGHIVGMEFLNARDNLPLHVLTEAA
jgi:uncharacterized protein YuzE